MKEMIKEKDFVDSVIGALYLWIVCIEEDTKRIKNLLCIFDKECERRYQNG
jgi:hypothetical protein